MASVGKLSATLVKANRRSKWPRLLASKEKKVNNMHYWMDFAEIHEESLKGLPTPKHSLVTCRLVKKAYCLGEDKCVSSCADDCRGKLFTGPDGRCLGKPQEEVSGVNFTDSDPKQGFIGGIVEVNSTATFGDAEFFSIYFLDEDNNKLSDQPILRIENPKSRGTNLSGKIPPSTPIPEEASKITAVPGNLAFGEPDSQRDFAPSSSSLLDLAVPTCTPQKIDLEDTSPEVGQLGGDVKISFSAHAEDSASPTVDYYTLHWGRTANSCERLPGGNSYIVRVRAKGVGEVQHHIGESIAIEKGAESILAFSQHENTDGPHPSKGELTSSCAIWPIRGRSSPSKPPQGLSVLNGQLLANGSRFSGEVIVKRAGRGDEVAAEATAYTLWWCDDDERKLSLLDSPNIEDTTAATDFRLVYEEVEVPEKASKICAFMKNDLGEGRQGAAAAVVSDTARDEL
ncbi:hypothetical protein FOL46_002348 [Perkinsus olseni]|uniref:Uncharacterized protein n=1 Tax=Perkinsus olseni TaxID=32597 RepID=A0A7J6M8I5_PEROL|nr:hypothetical protein FOL46_002348 [Perkinsus olseni]